MSRRRKVDTDRRRETDCPKLLERIILWSQPHKVIIVAGLFYYNLHLIWLHGRQEQERRAGKTLRVSVCGFQNIQARARTVLRAKHSKLWDASYKGKKPTTTTTDQAAESRRIGRKCLCVYVNFHLWPQVTDNCKYVELSIWTPKRVTKLKHTASHYARVQHLFSDRGWCSMNTAKNQLLVTDDPVEVQDFRKITDHSRESVEYISTS